MGKAQSKRSVDITTDPKKAGEGDEVAGKVEKIEDIDQKEAAAPAPSANGDATPQEKGEGDKKESEESENDKDLTTEKNAEVAAATNGGDDNAPNSPESPKDEQQKDGAGAEEKSPLADESIKSKSKKDKLKNKWSFRNISFGKKDKQKPAKREEAAAAEGTAAPAATNGEVEKTEEGNKKEEEAAGDAATAAAPAAADATETKPTENGDATVQEQLNGDKTPSPTEEQPKQNDTNESNAAAAINNTTTTTETSPANSNNDTAKETVAATVETVAAAATVAVATAAETNAATAVTAEAAAPVSNGNAAADEVAAAVASEESISNNKATIPTTVNDDVNDEKPHQNGTNGEEHAEPAEAEPTEAELIKNKSQIEVNTISAGLVNDNEESMPTPIDTGDALTSITNLPTTIASELDQTQSLNITTTINSESSNIVNNISDNIEIVKTISQEEEEEQVVASIIAAVSETPVPGAVADAAAAAVDTIVANFSNATIINDVNEHNVVVDIDNQQIVQLSGEGVSISNVEKPENELSVTPPPPPLPVSQPPSQVSVFAFKDSTETNTTSTTTTTTTNESEESSAPLDNPEHIEAQIVTDTLEQTDSLVEESIIITPPTTTTTPTDEPPIVIEQQESETISEIPQVDTQPPVALEDPKVDVIDLPIEAISPFGMAEEILPKQFETKVTISEPAQTNGDNVETTDAVLAEVKKEAEEIIAAVTEKAVEIVMQQQQQIDEINIAENVDENNAINNDEAQTATRQTTPPPTPNNEFAESDSEIATTTTTNEHITAATTTTKIGDDDDADNDDSETKNSVDADKLITIETEQIVAVNETTVNTQMTENEIILTGGDSNGHENSIHHNNDDVGSTPITATLEINPIKGVIEFDVNELDDSSNKDIASAKDLKENVAAEITTQELAVTCE